MLLRFFSPKMQNRRVWDFFLTTSCLITRDNVAKCLKFSPIFDYTWWPNVWTLYLLIRIQRLVVRSSFADEIFNHFSVYSLSNWVSNINHLFLSLFLRIHIRLEFFLVIIRLFLLVLLHWTKLITVCFNSFHDFVVYLLQLFGLFFTAI